MSTTPIAETAGSARQRLASVLATLQQDPKVPPAILEIITGLARALGPLFQLERGSDDTQLVFRARTALQETLGAMQSADQGYPGVGDATEAIAAALGMIFNLIRTHGLVEGAAPAPAPPVAAPVPPPQPRPLEPISPDATAPVPLVQPAPHAQPLPLVQQTAQQPANQQTAQAFAPTQPVHQQPAPAPAPAPQPLPATQPLAQQPVPPVAPTQPLAQQPAPPPPAQHPAPEPLPLVQPPARPVPLVTPAHAQPSRPADLAPPAQHRETAGPPSKVPRITVFPETAAKVPLGPNGLPRLEAALDVHSETNFYTNFFGDIRDHGGIFVATYSAMAIGTQCEVALEFPGDLRADVRGVVRWRREVASSAEITPGLGVEITHATDDGWRLIDRFVRKREPIIHDV